MPARPVIAATDGSEESFLAVQWAAREAVLRGATLCIVSVPAMPLPMTWATSGMLAAREREAAGRAVETAAARAAEVAPGLAISTELLSGPAARALAARGRDASMLVVGSRGAGGFSALMLGSVSRHVATHAACPVVVARAESMAAHREIVVGVADPRRSGAAVSFAFEEADLRQAKLLAVHACAPPRPSPPPGPPAATAPAAPGGPEAPPEEGRHLEALLAGWRETYPRVRSDWEVAHAHPGRVLAGASAHADLVVLGRGPAGSRGGGGRPVIHSVLTHAHGPVATIPDE